MARNPVTHSQVIISLGEFGDFEEASGAEFDGVLTDYYEAGARSPRKIPGTHSISDLVLTRAYDAAQDALLVDWVIQVLANTRPDRTRTARKTILNSMGIPIDGFNYALCKPRHIKLPDSKAGDSSLAMITVTLGVEAVL